MGGSLATALVYGWRTIGTVVAMDPHGQVVLAEGDHAAAECADGAFAPHTLLKLEADEDAQPEDQFANARLGEFVLA